MISIHRVILKYIVLSLFVFVIFNNIILADKLDDFKAPNYKYLEQTIYSNNIAKDLQKSLKGRVAFLFVSGCHLDKEALPGFFKLVKKYKDVKFIRMSQHAAKKFMLERYASFGAPKVYLMVNGNIASSLKYYYGKKGFIGWEKSIIRWGNEVFPILKDLGRYKNIIPLTSYNYADVMKDKNFIIYRGDSGRESFKEGVKILYALAKKNPEYNFGITTGRIGYNMEFDYKFSQIINGFSIVSNIDRVNAILRVNRRTKISPEIVKKWIVDNLNSDTRFKEYKIYKKGNYLKLLLQGRRGYEVATMKPQEFNSLNKKDKVIEKLNLMQSFYILLNAATSSNRNFATAKILITELKYKSKGGIAKAIKSKILREKVYVTVIKRKIKHEKNSEIKKMLIGLKNLYEK